MLSSVGFTVCSLLTAVSFPIALSVQVDELKIPESQQEPVVVFDSYGGFRAVSPDDLNEPMLRVYADGRVVRGRRTKQFAQSEIRLTRSEVQDLLELIIKENHFFEISTQQIEDQIKATGKRIMIADAPSSRFMVQLGDRKHQVDVYALGFIKHQFAEIDDLQRLANLEQHLVWLAALAAVGGEEPLVEMLERVNRELKRESPAAAPFSSKDLTYGIAYADGRKSFRFTRLKRAENRIVESVSAAIDWPAEGEPKIQVRVFPKK